MDSQQKKGIIEILVLSVLRKGESYGYQIIGEMQPLIDVTESTLYPILRRLTYTGCLLVREEEFNKRTRKYYSITDKGKVKLQGFKNTVKEISKIYDFILEDDNE